MQTRKRINHTPRLAKKKPILHRHSYVYDAKTLLGKYDATMQRVSRKNRRKRKTDILARAIRLNNANDNRQNKKEI